MRSIFYGNKRTLIHERECADQLRFAHSPFLFTLLKDIYELPKIIYSVKPDHFIPHQL